MFYIFYHVTFATVIPNALVKLYFFIHRINNHITVYRYGTSIDKFDNHVFKCSNKKKHVTKESYFKFILLCAVNNENELLCFESYFHKMGFGKMNC